MSKLEQFENECPIVTILTPNNKNIIVDRDNGTLTLTRSLAIGNGTHVFSHTKDSTCSFVFTRTVNGQTEQFRDITKIYYNSETDEIEATTWDARKQHQGKYYYLGNLRVTNERNDYINLFGATYNMYTFGFIYSADPCVALIDWDNKLITFRSGILYTNDYVYNLKDHTIDFSDYYSDSNKTYALLLCNKNGEFYVWDGDTGAHDNLSNFDVIFGYMCNINNYTTANSRFCYLYGYGEVKEHSKLFARDRAQKDASLGAFQNTYYTFNGSTLTIHMQQSYIPQYGKGFTTKDYVFENVGSGSRLALNFYYDYVTNDMFDYGWDTPIESIDKRYSYIGTFYQGKLTILGQKVCGWCVGNPATGILRKYRINVFGDSITAGVGATYPFHYWTLLYGDFYCRNFGIGSIGYLVETSSNVCYANGILGPGTYRQESGNNSIKKVIQNNLSGLNSDYDAIVIFAGTNDFGSSKTMAEFETAIRDCYTYVLDNFAGPLIVCTPCHRASETNSISLKLKDYVNKIKEVCDDMNIPVIDFYNACQFHAERDNHKTKYIPDGLHPSNLGHAIMGAHFNLKLHEYINI